MRVVIAGATGMIGAAVSKHLLARGDQVVALSRDAQRARQRLPPDTEVHEWRDPEREPPPAEALERADTVMNLLGEPIAQRWTQPAKREIRRSRILSTRALVGAMLGLSDDVRPRAFVSQSAVGYYGPRGDEEIDEDTPPGDDFLASVTGEWEREADAASPNLRVVKTRTGVVLGRGSGALAKMIPPFRLGIGGPVAGGRQYVPWIHLDDVAAALIHCAADERAEGPVNLTAPTPVSNRELSQTLGRVLHRPAVLPVPALALRLLYGEMASIVLTGQRVLPKRLHALGFRFTHPELEPALADVLAPADGQPGVRA